MDRFLKSASDLCAAGGRAQEYTTSTAVINHFIQRLDILAKGIESTLINRITTVPALEGATLKVGLCATPSMLESITRQSRDSDSSRLYCA